MLEPFATATLWMALAILSTIIANRLKISMALIEICVGAAAGYVAARYAGPDALGANTEWLKFIAASGAVLLTFLAGTELDPSSMKDRLREVTVVGSIGLAAPFVTCTAIAHLALGWTLSESLIAGIALSSTSMAVIYSVMLEYGFNKTAFGKGILGASFLNDLGTIVILGALFAPFTFRSLVFLAASAAAFFLMPAVTRLLTRAFGHRTAAVRTKWILFLIFGLGSLALWAGSEAVLPAYICGMVLSNTVKKDELFVRRLRTLTIGFLTPFFFLRAGTLVSLPAVLAAPLAFAALLAGKVASKMLGLLPVIGRFRENRREKWYYTLLMSTGLTFGTISALYGLNHGIISKEKYSLLVAAVIGTAVLPTLVANLFFLPEHLLEAPVADEEIPQLDAIEDWSKYIRGE